LRYVADIYFRDDDLSRFDLVVIVKNFNWLRPDALRRLRARGTWLLYDTADIRYVRTAEGLRDLYVDRDVYESHFRPFVHSMDALILASPLQRPEFADLSIPQVEIPRPLLNTRHRTAYAHGGPIRLVWHGYLENLPPMQQLHPIVQRLRADTSLDIRLVYDTAGRPRVDGFIEYREWKIERWERVLVESDIGVVIKPLEDPFQQRKPPTKVVTYMGAGLPVVCTPSEADRGVITHGETGFFARDDREWYDCLRALVTDAELRARIGTAGRHHVEARYGVERITGMYVALFDQLLAGREAGRPRPSIDSRHPSA
jgi:glycosyltransferase involved in cell wall biosynthesis